MWKQILVELATAIFNENPSSGSRVTARSQAGGRTDIHTDRHNEANSCIFPTFRCERTKTGKEIQKCTKLTKTKLRGLSPQANYTDRATAAVGGVVPTFAVRGCYVVSATDSHGR
jgi:hypothetical protein